MPHVDSSAVTDVDYEPEQRILLVRFQSGKIYGYAEVPPELYAEFLAAESKGHFFQDYVRDRFDYWRL